jgi:hypothetical protein
MTSGDESSACSGAASVDSSVPPPLPVEQSETNYVAEEVECTILEKEQSSMSIQSGAPKSRSNNDVVEEVECTTLEKEQSSMSVQSDGPRSGSNNNVVEELECTAVLEKERASKSVQSGAVRSRSNNILFHFTRFNKFQTSAATRSPPEEERGAIEVEASGLGLTPSVALNDTTKDIITILPTNSDSNEDITKTPPKRRRRPYVMIGLIAILLLSTLVGLGLAIGRNSSRNESDASSSSLKDITVEDETGADIIDVDVPPSTNATATPEVSESTESPTDSTTGTGSSAATIEVTPDGQTISCGPNHNIIAMSTCQKTSPATTVLYCFATTRDGDWYWIRGKESDNELDVWDYTNGASDGRLEYGDDIPPGTYLVSLVRDSMEPYNVIITQELVVPNCTTSA